MRSSLIAMKFIRLSKKFLKDFEKLDGKIRKAFHARKDLFVTDITSPLLNIHPLHGEYAGCKSFSITGNVRVVYEEYQGGCELVRIGTHSELYG
jgi:addiction module RelE/StbE family toxin